MKKQNKADSKASSVAQTPERKANLNQIRATKTPLGIALVYYGLQLYVLGLFLAFGLGLFLGLVLPLVGSFISLGALASAVMIGSGLLLVAALISSLGKILCLTAPPNLPGKWAIFVAIVLEWGTVLVGHWSGLAASLSGMFHFSFAVTNVLSSLANALTPLGFLFFLIFLKGLCEQVGDAKLTASVKKVQVLLVIIAATATIVIVMKQRTAVSMQFSDLITVFVGLIVLVVCCLRALIVYSSLLQSLRTILAQPKQA